MANVVVNGLAGLGLVTGNVRTKKDVHRVKRGRSEPFIGLLVLL